MPITVPILVASSLAIENAKKHPVSRNQMSLLPFNKCIIDNPNKTELNISNFILKIADLKLTN